MLRVCLVALLLGSWLSSAHADAPSTTIYAKADLSNLMRAMLRTGALDAGDPQVREDYLMAHECELYRQNFRDEFKLKRVIDATAKVIQQDRTAWPNAFTYLTPLKLDHYDFTTEQYILDKESQLRNVNSFALFTESPTCISGKLTTRFPTSVAVRIDQPITLTGIPLPRAQAEALQDQLAQGGGLGNKQIFARFSIVVSFMPPIEPMLAANQTKLTRYVFDGRLMQVEFFQDEAMNKPIWTMTR